MPLLFQACVDYNTPQFHHCTADKYFIVLLSTIILVDSFMFRPLKKEAQTSKLYKNC